MLVILVLLLFLWLDYCLKHYCFAELTSKKKWPLFVKHPEKHLFWSMTCWYCQLYRNLVVMPLLSGNHGPNSKWRHICLSGVPHLLWGCKPFYFTFYLKLCGLWWRKTVRRSAQTWSFSRGSSDLPKPTMRHYLSRRSCSAQGSQSIGMCLGLPELATWSHLVDLSSSGLGTRSVRQQTWSRQSSMA